MYLKKIGLTLFIIAALFLGTQTGLIADVGSSGFSFFKPRTNIASKYDKYVNPYMERTDYEEHTLEVYWQVTRSDSRYSSLSQTETHRQIWSVREDPQDEMPFSIVSSQIKIPIRGSVSDYLGYQRRNFYVISMDKINLVKLLGLDEKQLEQGEGGSFQNQVVSLYVGEGYSSQNSFSFTLLPEDYYEVRLELKMLYQN